MNLAQFQKDLGTLFPPLVTRSKLQIKTHEVSCELTHGGLAVTVKTLFPPSARRRSELLVTSNGDALRVRPENPADMADAQRFAERVRDRWLQEEPDAQLEPLRLIKESGVSAFHIARRAAAAPQGDS